MADSVGMSAAQQIAQNYQKYKDYFTENKNDSLGQSDFLALMVEQMKSQDVMNPTDNAEFIAQLAQFNSLQSMQQMSQSSNATYAATLVGKVVRVSAGTTSDGKQLDDLGVVSSVRNTSAGFEVVVNGNAYSTANVVEIIAVSISE